MIIHLDTFSVGGLSPIFFEEYDDILLSNWIHVPPNSGDEQKNTRFKTITWKSKNATFSIRGIFLSSSFWANFFKVHGNHQLGPEAIFWASSHGENPMRDFRDPKQVGGSPAQPKTF